MVVHQEPGTDAVPGVHRSAPVEEGSWTWGSLAMKKQCVAFIEKALKKLVVGGLDGVWPFGTFFSRRVVSLAVRTTKMWEYTGPADPDRVSPEPMSDDEVWSWLKMVLKVGNQWAVRGPTAFDREHPPNLVDFSPFLLLVSLRVSGRALRLPCFLGAWSSPVLPTSPEGARGHGKAGRPSGSFPGQEGEESKKG
jgi:hypothetical protein